MTKHKCNADCLRHTIGEHERMLQGPTYLHPKQEALDKEADQGERFINQPSTPQPPTQEPSSPKPPRRRFPTPNQFTHKCTPGCLRLTTYEHERLLGVKLTKEQQKSIRRELGRIGNERGQKSEQRVFEALTVNHGEPLPKWLLSVRKATKEEDHEGIDLVITSDVGKLFLQVKSTKAGVKTGYYTRRHIGVLYARSHEALTLRTRALQLLSELRNKFLQDRQPA